MTRCSTHQFYLFCLLCCFFFLKWQSVIFPTKALNSCFKQWHSWRISHHAIPFPCTMTVFHWIASLLVSEEKSFTFTNLLIFSVLQVVHFTVLLKLLILNSHLLENPKRSDWRRLLAFCLAITRHEDCENGICKAFLIYYWLEGELWETC